MFFARRPQRALLCDLNASLINTYTVVRDRVEELIGVLDRRTASVGWLADHFKMLPTTEAVKPLLGALSKHRGNAALSARIIAALKPCTGFVFGTDPAAEPARFQPTRFEPTR